MKRRATAIFSVFAIALALPAALFATASGVQAEFDNSVNQSIAAIAVRLEQQDAATGSYLYDGLTSSGTCFFVGKEGTDPEYLVTNYHVAEDYLENGQGQWMSISGTYNGQAISITQRVSMRVYFAQNDYVEAYPVVSDAVKDIAVLRLDQPTNKRRPVRLMEPTQEMQGQECYVLGYPGISDNIYADPVSKWGLNDATLYAGHISRLGTTSGTGVRQVQTDATIQHGQSGSPMTINGGYVIGINTWSASSDEEKVYYATNISEAIPLLNQGGAPYELVEAGAATALPTESVETSGDLETSADAVEVVQNVDSDGGSQTVAIALIVVAAAAVAGILLYLSRKKSAPTVASAVPTSESAVQPTPAPQSTSVPFVRSLAPQHRGAHVSLGNGQILIGRDLSAAVVFKEGTPGVSGQHCTLAYDAGSGDFLLTDMKSTYGTYLKNGQRLEPGKAYRLRAGDSFYLGQPENELRVEMG